MAIYKTGKVSPAPTARKVRSSDGTAIAIEQHGRGFAVILVDGALCYRALGQSAQLAQILSANFSVYTYDRRGRGESADTLPYAVDREVEDIEAILHEAGGTACVWGMSSGAVLALEAAKRLPGILKLALYEAPFIVDASRPTTERDWQQIDEAVAANRRSESVNLFLKSVGVPFFIRVLMRLTPLWRKLKAISHTLPYDGAIVRAYQIGRPLPASRWATVAAPVLVMDGGDSPAWIRRATQSLGDILPQAKYRTIEGQTHMLKPRVHAPILLDFFEHRP